MEYLGKSPNGLNQLSSSLIALFVSGSKIVDFSSASINVVGRVTASGVQTYEIDSFGTLPLEIKSNTQISGSLSISSSITASLFKGDGSELFNIQASSIGDINRINKTQGTNFEFASSNVLWRATLKSLDFLPLINADYTGGVIIYDWYSQNNNPKEQIKISVQFLNNELRSDSIKITAHKKICETIERCSNSTLDQNFANSIKDSIIASARTLKIEEAKKEKK